MQYIELHNVEYGECIVLGGGRGEILMVDCGSMNRVRREDGRELSLCVNEGILERYRRAPSRAFLLSHCHREHLSGFWNLLGKEPRYFNQIFLPASPCDHLGRALLLEFALFVFVFLRDQTDYSRANIASLRLYERAARASTIAVVSELKNITSGMYTAPSLAAFTDETRISCVISSNSRQF